MKRKASVRWQGSIKDGRGSISTESKALSEQPYSFGSRFESRQGTNPEELIAAAHAGCFSMALALELSKVGLTPDSIETSAAVNIDKQGEGFTIDTIHLDVLARIPGADESAFEKAANAAKAGCPVSKVLNADITMSASLKK
ncbi:MAG TPA: OsmC family protein [Gammaproteobacteria bacterium]|nr:OsmC family protein [Gammaproteobacteria bacterium]